ncbi:type II secretion system major pseudopilin GspG [Skermanella pratensis]|uniref:type II secretion system major pseudopilin GspG n=1 Tax=Skermanella pratensis TaxID=2233999 RepID=UPI001FE46CB2|nr:type II secretion system major pseudopilin GspG [Skermanella pratensis]
MGNSRQEAHSPRAIRPIAGRRTPAGRMSHRKRPSSAAGFTLLELLVVLVILGLLASVTAPAVARYLSGAKVDAAKLQIQNLSTTLDMYRLDTGSYPSQQDGLKALVQRPSGAQRWNGPYLRKADMIKDPWGQEYHYRTPGERAEVEVFTLGADKAAGGTGENQDLGSW